MKVMVVFGTRPEAIKMCPVVLELKQHREIDTVVCLTGQHQEMLCQAMKAFNVEADYNLGVMHNNQTLSQLSCEVMTRLDEVYENEKPDLVLVHGDTTSSFIAALTAFYHHIPIGHVEAGLRTYDFQSPFPEEFNRQGVDLISNIYFAPTAKAKMQLLEEGKKDDTIFVTGNTAIDAMKITVCDEYAHPVLDWVGTDRMILLTVHRRENLGNPMRNIFRAIKRIVNSLPDVKVVYPIHLNPKVREIANEILDGEEKIKLIEPLDVVDFHNFMKASYFILTDSGGIQEEAPSLGKPVLVARNVTERPEGVEVGTLKLVGTSEEIIFEESMKLLINDAEYERMSKAANPYGDGTAAKRIVKEVIDYIID